KNTTESLTTNRIEKDKEIVSAPSITNMTIDLYDSTIDQPEFSVVLSSESTDTSITPEIEHIEPIDDKPKFPEIIELVNDEPEISSDLPGVIIPQPCKECGRETKLSVQLCVPCGQEPEYNKEFNESEEVLNLSTNRWIKFNGRLYKKLLHEGYKYTKDLSQYLEEVPLIDIGEYGTIYPLVNFYHSALIPPLSILARRGDICSRCPIIMTSVVEGGMSLFTIEKNGKTSLDNLIEMNYSSLFVLLKMCWNSNKVREWRSDILMKFLHHLNSISLKYSSITLYDAFIKTNVLEPEHILALAQAL
ncbi:8341_t:CDS:2, partial [Gigaspora margarita]